MNLINMKIGVKLGLGFATIIFLILTLSVTSLVQNNDLGNLIRQQNETRREKLERLYVTREALDQTGLAARNAFIYTEDADAKKELDLLDRQKAIYLDALSALKPLFAGSSDFDRVHQGLLAMATELNRPRQYREAKKMQEFGEFLVKECSPLRRQIVADIDVLLKSVQQKVDLDSKHAEQSIEHNGLFALGMSGVATGLAIVIGIWLTRGLLKQLGADPNEVSKVAQGIARGDLTAEIKMKENDRSSVMYAMKEMRDSLANIVVQVRAGTDTIATASSQIASGNMDLSSRTEQQASSLEETASSMEELTSTVRQNAENADQANRLAIAASDIAAKGGAVVSKVVETMDLIHASASKIADITSVIDGIAFQTNILSLNAAVEAARAGEQGRGFAVVATEVRNLAQRSAAAAKEIKALIGDSVEKVENGSKLVAQAGTTMSEVVGSVKRVTDTMAAITAASREQSTGIEQVNQAIGHMDQVTQQNAALVEEAAAAAEALQDQASRLSELVDVFQIASAQVGSASALRPLPNALAKPDALAVSNPLLASASHKKPAMPDLHAPTATGRWEEF